MSRDEPPKKAAANRTKPLNPISKMKPLAKSKEGPSRVRDSPKKEAAGRKAQEAHDDLSLNDPFAPDRDYRVNRFSHRYKNLVKRIEELKADFGITSVLFCMAAPLMPNKRRQLYASGVFRQPDLLQSVEKCHNTEVARLRHYNKHCAAQTESAAPPQHDLPDEESEE